MCVDFCYKEPQKETPRFHKKYGTRRVSGGFPPIESAIIFANAIPKEASLWCYCDSSARRTFPKMPANNDTDPEKGSLRGGYKGVKPPALRAGVFLLIFFYTSPPRTSPDSPALVCTLVRPNQTNPA